jgi:integrase
MAVKPNLAQARINSLKDPGLHVDRGNGAVRGLYLQVTAAQRGGERDAAHGVTRSWIIRYVSPTTGRTRWMGLGSLADGIGQAEARELAMDARRLVKLGIDPIDERERKRKAARLERAKQLTFAQAADAYVQKQSGSWTNEKHRRQWRASIDRANRSFGDQPVEKIDKAVVVDFLRPIWKRTPASASRLRNRVEQILDWAIAADAREGPNPARWAGNLEHLFPAVKPGEHFAALPFDQVPGFMLQLRKQETTAARALEFLVLTAARSAEVTGATWDEVDFKARTWVVPGSRMKAGREHSVPLSDGAVEILKGLNPEGSGPIFAGIKANTPIGPSAMLKVLHSMGRKGVTTHGMRSSFRDWAGELTDAEHETVEFALAHHIPDQAAAAYRRYRSLAKRRGLMEAWADYVDGKIGGATVISLLGRKRA